MASDLHLDQMRNLYYFGHGSSSTIGQVGAYFGIRDAHTALNNYPRYANFPRHPFRFVFLDGCKTASGDWCKAFGIPRIENMSTNNFLNKGIRFRAFLGWNDTILERWPGGPDPSHLNFIGNLLETWPSYYPGTTIHYKLVDAIDAAKGGYAPTVDRKLKIYGFKWLQFDDTIP